MSTDPTQCNKAPQGWSCSRELGHEGPCAASPLPPEKERPAWLRFIIKYGPTNLKKVITYLVSVAAIALVNVVLGCFGVQKQDQIELPEVVLPIWPDGIVQPTDADRAQTLMVLRIVQGFGEFNETEANQIFTDDTEDVCLWKIYAIVNGIPLPSWDQGPIGTCVSFGYAGAIVNRQAIQIHKKLGAFAKVPEVATEVIYGGSRVDANGGKLPPDLRGGDGSCGAWAVRWLSTGGVCERKVVAGVDLSAYSVERSRSWGNTGVPAAVKEECKKNLCTYALVANSEELLKSLQVGAPVAVCSNVGFGDMSRGITRDSEGRLKASGNWGHCMYFVGYRADIKCFLCVNSWGTNWVKGPKGKYQDIPDGSFWVDWSTANNMLSSSRDSYAISGVNGFKRNKLKPDDWAVKAQPVLPMLLKKGEFQNVFAMGF